MTTDERAALIATGLRAQLKAMGHKRNPHVASMRKDVSSLRRAIRNGGGRQSAGHLRAAARRFNNLHDREALTHYRTFDAALGAIERGDLDTAAEMLR